MTALLLLALSATATIRVQVEGDATEVLAFRLGHLVARAPVGGGIAELACREEADLIAVGPGRRSELERRVRPATGPGFDAVLVTHPSLTLAVRTEPGARVHVGGASFPAGAVPLLPGMHRIVVDHPAFLSSASLLIRMQQDRSLDVALDPGLVVHGTLSGRDGKPLAGARVDVFADGYPTARGAISDERGRYAVSGFRGRVVSLRVQAEGHATRLIRVPFEPGSERARVEVALGAGAAVALPVDRPVRATLLPRWLDRALEEPRLAANDEAPRIEADRRVTFDGLAPGRVYRILLEADGMIPAASPPFEAGAQAELKAIALQRAARIRGRLDQPGRLVVCRGAFGDRVCRTDRAGRFSFDGLEPGKVLLFVRDLDERGHVVDVQGAGEVEVTLPIEAPPAERMLEGTVLDADRAPLADVLVEAAGLHGRTDERGEFRIGPMPLGRARFELRLEPAPGSRGFLEDPHLPRTESKAQPGIKVRAQLERAGALDLRFPGARVARATLLLEGTSGVRQEWRIPRGAPGLRIDEIPVGDYVVEAAAPGCVGTGGAVCRAVAGDPEPIEVPLLRGRTVSGRVVKRRGLARAGRTPHLVDEPVAEGAVTLFDGAARLALATAPIARDGSFVLEGLPSGPVLICAAVAGHPVGVARVDLADADAESVVIPVFSPMPAGLQLRIPDGRPVPDVRIAVLSEQGFDVRDIAARARFRGVVADDREFDDIGLLFRLERREGAVIEHRGLAPGNYEFRVFAEGYKPGTGKVRVRPAWTLEHIGSLLPEFSNPVVPVWLTPKPVATDPEKRKGE